MIIKLLLVSFVFSNVVSGFYHYDLTHGGIRREQSSAFCKRDLSTLRQMIIVFRYGDITPVTTFPTDIYQEHSWPLGFGQLTRRGVERSYELGLWARNCYDSFLHKNISPKRVFARSTDYDRTLMSAQAYLAGAFPPTAGFQTGSQKWGETSAYKLGQLWFPFPVHTVPARYDRLLRGNLNCPRFEELTKQIDFSKKTKKLMARHKRFLDKLAHKSGLKTEDMVKVVSIVESAVLVEVENGRVPVPWLNSEKDLDTLAYFRDSIVGLYFNNPELTKLVSGKLVQEIIDRLHTRASGHSTLEHILYAGHSTVMEGILASLGVLNSVGHREPPYGSAIIFELHKMQDHSYAVAAYYRNSSTHDPIPLTIPGCNIKESDEDHKNSAKSSSEESRSESSGQGAALETKVKTTVRRDKKSGKTHQPKSHRRAYNSKEDEPSKKRRLTYCKLKDFKKALTKKATRHHDFDCRPKHPHQHHKVIRVNEQPKKKHSEESVEAKVRVQVKKEKKSLESEEVPRKKIVIVPHHKKAEKSFESSEERSVEKKVRARAPVHRRERSFESNEDVSRENKKVRVQVQKETKSIEFRRRPGFMPYRHEFVRKMKKNNRERSSFESAPRHRKRERSFESREFSKDDSREFRRKPAHFPAPRRRERSSYESHESSGEKKVRRITSVESRSFEGKYRRKSAPRREHGYRRERSFESSREISVQVKAERISGEFRRQPHHHPDRDMRRNKRSLERKEEISGGDDDEKVHVNVKADKIAEVKDIKKPALPEIIEYSFSSEDKRSGEKFPYDKTSPCGGGASQEVGGQQTELLVPAVGEAPVV